VSGPLFFIQNKMFTYKLHHFIAILLWGIITKKSQTKELSSLRWANVQRAVVCNMQFHLLVVKMSNISTGGPLFPNDACAQLDGRGRGGGGHRHWIQLKITLHSIYSTVAFSVRLKTPLDLFTLVIVQCTVLYACTVDRLILGAKTENER
jgi:hypothetical protein